MKEKKESPISSICTRQMKWIKKAERLCLAAGVISLFGCGGSGSTANSSYMSYDTKDAAMAEESVANAEYGAGAFDYEEKEIEPAEYETDESSAPVSLEKLVYRGALTIQSRDYSASAAALRTKIHSFNGIIENENEYTEGGYYVREDSRNLWVLYLTVRIPTERFEEFMNGNDEIGNVISRSTSTENISRRYNDVSAQIEALEKQQKRLLEMMDKAETIEDMIAVEDRLSEVQYELNSLKTNREAMDTDVAYSTVNITLREVKVYTETSENFFTKLGSRFVNGFSGFAEHMGKLVLGIAYIFPYLILIGIILAVLKMTGKMPHIHMPKFFRRKNGTE